MGARPNDEADSARTPRAGGADDPAGGTETGADNPATGPGPEPEAAADANGSAPAPGDREAGANGSGSGTTSVREDGAEVSGSGRAEAHEPQRELEGGDEVREPEGPAEVNGTGHDPAGRVELLGATAASGKSRRPPAVTTDTARPEGGGRAAPGDAPAPARQWPLLTVLGMTGLGLLIVGTDLFPQAFRVGAILIGVALLTGAVMRRTLPSVGMLAVRSRFTDMVTYGLMGVIIVLLALMLQPRPWLEIPFLEDALHVTVT